MRAHVKSLAWIQIFHGSVLLLAGAGTALLLGGASDYYRRSDGGGDASAMVTPMLGLLGKGLLLVASVLSVPRLIAGIGLLFFAPWARALTLVIAAFGFIDFPIGTATGGYAYWVLMSRDTMALFRPRREPPPLPLGAGREPPPLPLDYDG